MLDCRACNSPAGAKLQAVLLRKLHAIACVSVVFSSLTTSCLLTGGVAFRRERDWILGVWTNHFLSTLVALPVLASFFYWALTIGALVLYPLSAVGVVDVVKALDFTGLGSLLVHSIPAKTYCQDLLQHPFALVVSAALVAYYLSIATVWAEGSSPIFHSYPQLGEFHLLYQIHFSMSCAVQQALM